VKGILPGKDLNCSSVAKALARDWGVRRGVRWGDVAEEIAIAWRRDVCWCSSIIGVWCGVVWGGFRWLVWLLGWFVSWRLEVGWY